MKNTKQKKVILDIINNSNNHLDAYQIYDEARKQISNISLGTVYRNLGGLENDNLIISLMVNGVKLIIKLFLIIILYVKSVLR